MTTGDTTHDPALADDSALARAVDEYLALAEGGRRPDRSAFLARHPDLAGPLADALDGLDFVRSAAPQLSRASGGEGTVAGGEPITGVLGDYRIVREVGRGGMGVVYEAEQLSLGRRVALKVLPFAAVMDPRHLQRFRNEARAAASLDHPHAVKVHGVGCERGVHFIALQFVDGRPLSDLVRDRRGEPAAPPTATAAADATASYAPGRAAPAVADQGGSSGVPPRGDAAYFRTVVGWGAAAANALEHAHSLGVVHRDVKPGNLLVDGGGHLYVADFGLAKVSADPGVTGTGDLLGTVRYMSPEQAGARHDLVDHRSDVYSLGVTLYELLTLAPAFAGSSRAAVLSAVLTSDPAAPRSHDRGIPKDLETVVLKAMDKDPARRYQTAGELAADLRRFLEHKPIAARRPTPLDRAAKWARRHRAAVAAGVGFLAVTAAVSTVAALFIADRQAGKDRALAEKDQALGERRLALQSKDQALGEREAALERATAEKRRVEDTLGDAAALLGGLPTDFPTLAEREGNYDGVIRKQRQAAVLQERVVADRPNDRELRRVLANWYTQLHWSAAQTRRLHQYVDTARRAVALAGADVAAERGTRNEDGMRLILALALTTLGDAQLAAGDADGAADAFGDAMDNWTAAFAAEPAFGKGFFGHDVMRTRGGRAAAMAAQGKHEDAVAEYRAALALANEFPPDDFALRRALEAAPLRRRLGDVLWASGQQKEAGEAYAAAKAGWEKMGTEKGGPHTAELAWLLAVCPDPAVRDPKAALEYARTVKPGTPGGALAALVVAVAEWRTGDTAAKTGFQLLEAGPADEAAYSASRAVALHRQGKGDESRKWMGRATQAAKKCGEDPEVRRLLAEAAALLTEPAPKR